MKPKAINLGKSVTLVGGGEYTENDLLHCLRLAPDLVAADGGCNRLKGHIPKYIVGDLDSIIDKEFWKSVGSEIIEIPEQETTDFEKCLYTIKTKVYFCLGFTGNRLDHFFAVCSSLLKYHEQHVLVIGSHDVVLHLPTTFKIRLPKLTRVSLFPLKPVEGVRSKGLRWPIEELSFDLGSRIGTSNCSVEPLVEISVSNPGMLLILPKAVLKNIAKSLDASNQ